MKTKNVIWAIASLSAGLIQATSPEALGASSNQATSKGKKCEVVLNGEAGKPAAGSAITIRHSETPVRENVFIRDGYSQYPRLDKFGPDYVNNFHYVQDVTGDQTKVEIYPDAHPLSDRNQYAQQLNQQRNQIPLQNGSRTGRELSVGNQSPNQKALTNNTVNDYEAARTYAINSIDGRPDEASIRYLTEAILKNPQLLDKARSSFVSFVNSRKVELTNYGMNRYFWFQPEGSQEPVAARILDIHRDVHPEGYVFLAEYMTEAHSANGARTRNVVQVREAEFKTIFSELPGEEKHRQSAMATFLESLTPDEIRSLKLANQLNLKLYGYFDIRRRPGQERGSTPPPLQTMNSITYLAISKHIEDTFGSIEDLLTPLEKAQKYPNPLDVFSRLNPRYVMNRFGDLRALNTQFYWVITEDGQLKIIPAMERGNNLKPQILRFAGGRKIFTGGTFFLKPDGSLEVSMNANGFQQADVEWGHHLAYQGENGNINEFVEIIFGLQLGKKIASLNSQPLEQWYRNQRYTGTYRDHQNQSFQSSNRDNGFSDFFSSMKSQAQKAAASDQKEAFSWDQEKGIPMSLSQFATQVNGSANDATVKLDWAHYVLRTHSRMTWGDIKKTYRSLAQKFHPDHNKDSRAEKVLQEVTWAYRILEEALK